MKKLALTSLLAVFAVSGANAANVINGDPLYRPNEGRFYSVTSFESNTDFRDYVLGEEMGFGITDSVSVILNTSFSYDNPKNAESNTAWDYLSLGLSERYLNDGNWKGDIYGKVAQIYNTGHDFDTLRTDWYNWTVGTKFGYVATDCWTLAGTIEANYFTDDQSGFDFDAWGMKVGIEGLYALGMNWNVVAGLDYNFRISNNNTPWTLEQPMNAKMGVNYNLDSIMYFGAYVFKDVKSGFNEDPLGVGVKFGIDF